LARFKVNGGGEVGMTFSSSVDMGLETVNKEDNW